jgi:hypothetical protein
MLSIDGAPRGRAFALATVLGSQTDLRTPWYDGRAEIIPFRYLPVLLGGKGTSHVGWDTSDLPSQGENYGYRTPPGPGLEGEREGGREGGRERGMSETWQGGRDAERECV